MTTDKVTLVDAIRTFLNLCEAVTVPTDDGGRRVHGVGQAVALTDATATLVAQLSSLRAGLGPLGARVSMPPGLAIVNVTPEGEVPVPPEDIQVFEVRVGRGGLDPLKFAILSTTLEVLSPVRLNDTFGPPYHRMWQAGDCLTEAEMEVLRSALRTAQIVHAVPPTREQSADVQAISEDALLAPVSLLQVFGLPASDLNRLRMRLRDFRKSQSKGWIEQANAASREPHYFYRVAAVRPILEALRDQRGDQH